LGAHRVKPGAVLREGGRAPVELRQERVGEASASLGQAEERPGTFAMALDQPGLDQKLEVP
jgi:hypothetical protein